MKAEMANGEIMELDRECGCLLTIHAGPHWLHMDAIERADNLNLLAYADQIAAEARTMADANYVYAVIDRFAELEKERLRTKAAEMQRRGIVRLVEAAPPG